MRKLKLPAHGGGTQEVEVPDGFLSPDETIKFLYERYKICMPIPSWVSVLCGENRLNVVRITAGTRPKRLFYNQDDLVKKVEAALAESGHWLHNYKEGGTQQDF